MTVQMALSNIHKTVDFPLKKHPLFSFTFFLRKSTSFSFVSSDFSYVYYYDCPVFPWKIKSHRYKKISCIGGYDLSYSNSVRYFFMVLFSCFFKEITLAPLSIHEKLIDIILIANLSNVSKYSISVFASSTTFPLPVGLPMVYPLFACKCISKGCNCFVHVIGKSLSSVFW